MLNPIHQQAAEAIEQASSAKFDEAGIIEMFEYLDELRESGETNMFGARPYLVDQFEMEPKVAGAVLSQWMKTFETRKACPLCHTPLADRGDGDECPGCMEASHGE